MARRSAGTGSLLLRTDAAGKTTWYGKVNVGGRQVKRRLGQKREPGSTIGLTRTEAERELRRLIDSARPVARDHERLSIEEAGVHYLDHVEHVRGRKRSTVHDYRLILNNHLVPFFGTRGVERIDPDLVAGYISTKLRSLSPKTVNNHLNFLHGVLTFAVRRGWAVANPVPAVDRPSAGDVDPDVRYLTLEEVEALVRAAPNDGLGPTDAAIYVVGAMTGLRQGEIVALRWRDVDWAAGVIRVRRTFSRGEWGTPKSRRSSRAVPMHDRVARELEQHFRRSDFTGDDDLALCHPLTGGPYDASKLRVRFKRALSRARVREVRFHDLRHTFGTHMAAAGVPMRTLQEWMGHRDHKTTLIYADFAPDASGGRAFLERAFGGGTPRGTNLSESQSTEQTPEPLTQGVEPLAA